MRREALALAACLLVAAPARAEVFEGPYQPLFGPAHQRWLALEKARTGFPDDVGMLCASWTTDPPAGYFTMNRAFEVLPAVRKRRVLASFGSALGPIDRYDWALLDAKQVEGPGDYRIDGSRCDYAVCAFDGRLLSHGFTEASRYSDDDARNTGQAAGRQVHFPITEAHELAVRLAFWRFVGWHMAKQPYLFETHKAWIAWVPEHGYFEVDLPRQSYRRGWLAAFLRRLPRRERVLVLDNDGDMLEGDGALRFRWKLAAPTEAGWSRAKGPWKAFVVHEERIKICKRECSNVVA